MKTFYDQFIEEFKDMPFVKEGIRFGYPSCCIYEFVEFIMEYKNGNKIDRGTKKLHGTGYIPCAKCNEKAEQDLIVAINNNRQYAKPFKL